MNLISAILVRAQLARNYRRSRQIARVLARHGLDYLLAEAESDLGGFSGRIRRWFGLLRVGPESVPRHARMALEELGATFIKLGQILATRPDLLPAEYIAEFTQLYDNASPLPFRDIRRVIGQELGAPPEKVFQSIDPAPLGSASLSQVHAARLHTGQRVVVKVQRPGVAQQVDVDLTIIHDLAALAVGRSEWGETYDLRGWVAEFSAVLRDELDFTREGRHADRMRRNFQDDPTVHIPLVYWDYTTTRVLVMEDVSGIKISDLAALEAAGIDRRALAQNCARMALVQIFEHGFFHADPHPGNFFVAPDGTLSLIDFGQIGRLDDSLRETLLRLMLTINRRDAERLVDELLALGVAPRRFERSALKRDLEQLLHRYEDEPISGSHVFTEIMTLSLRHHLHLPSELTLLAKVIVTDEGMGSHLDPQFKLMEFARPYLKKFWMENAAPEALARRMRDAALDVAQVGQDLPRHIKRLLGQLERGEIRITSHIEESQIFVRHLDIAGKRIAASVLVAGSMVAFALSRRPPGETKKTSRRDRFKPDRAQENGDSNVV